MSSKHGSLNRSTALAAGVGFAALISVALLPRPALADKWKHHHHGHYRLRRARVCGRSGLCLS